MGSSIRSFPGGALLRNSPADAGDTGSVPGLGRFLGGGNGNPVLLPGKSNRQGNLAGYNPWSHRESDTTSMNSTGLPGLGNFTGLWARGVVSSCLEPDSGMMKAKEYRLLGCMGQTEEVRFWIGCFYPEGLPQVESLLSKNWPALEDSLSPSSMFFFIFLKFFFGSQNILMDRKLKNIYTVYLVCGISFRSYTSCNNREILNNFKEGSIWSGHIMQFRKVTLGRDWVGERQCEGRKRRQKSCNHSSYLW